MASNVILRFLGHWIGILLIFVAVIGAVIGLFAILMGSIVTLGWALDNHPLLASILLLLVITGGLAVATFKHV